MMARRLNAKHDEHTRNKIKVSNLITKLQNTALGNDEMTPGQMKAAEILLKKALPDLSAVEQHNTGDTTQYLVQVPLQAPDSKEWEAMAKGGGKKEPRIDHKSDEVH